MRYSDYTEPDPTKYDAKPLDAADELPDDPHVDRLCKHCGYSIKRHTGTFLVCPFGEFCDYQQFEDAEPQDDHDVPLFDEAVITERADYALLQAIDAIEEIVMETTNLEVAWRLRKVLTARERHLQAVADLASATIDRILERRR